MVVCEERLIENNKSLITSVLVLSKLPVGSSANRILGCLTMALAIATRCFSPPDNWFGKCLTRFSRPILSRASKDFFFAFLSPKISSGNITLSKAESLGNK